MNDEKMMMDDENDDELNNKIRALHLLYYTTDTPSPENNRNYSKVKLLFPSSNR